MAYWIKVNYDRNEYIVDLERLSAFSCAPNGRITFWLPNSGLPIVLTEQSDSEGYQQVLDYIKQLKDLSDRLQWESWIKIHYERNEYIINLNRISSFCYTASGRLTFWLSDSSIPIIINQNKDPDIYHNILEYIKRRTGHKLP